MELGLRGRVALVAGGASNIGRQITLSLAAEGADVVIADIDVAQAETVATLANASGAGRVAVVRCDVTQRIEVDAAVAETASRFGHPDVVVNNVGWSDHRLFMDKSWETAEREMALNLWGTIHMSKAVLPGMIERKSGRIICISSDAGKSGENRETIYSAAKAGVMGFVRSLAREVGRYAINVNGVCPSMTIPDDPADVGEKSMQYRRDRPAELMERVVKQYPLRRVGRPIDVANLVVFLSSEASSFITGQNISVNGGFLM